ncbi:hypothetical protein NITMOv2_3009 [Nitrospira moscoviensis]|uniref:Uncharacterized protein n=1 Tax=Nitrospira moscoviensis TaxID=42253 RepID=A0A0K2GF02_NITMO|nr:hypothetical protein NITMOv2_3009 [Nitrospira moscoviensis]
MFKPAILINASRMKVILACLSLDAML